MFRIFGISMALFGLLLLTGARRGCAAETTASTFADRVSTGARAISENPANRLPPVALGTEEFTSFTLEPGVRVTVQKPMEELVKPPHLILYLLPNGNTTEQALGRAPEAGLDWHYGIQHIAAQTRRVRELWTSRSVITAVVEADTLSWPAWRKAVGGAHEHIKRIVEEIRARAGDYPFTVDLVAHSGGGSFIWGFLNAHAAIPNYVQHIVLLDANYSYSDEDRHGDKLLAWLKASPEHRLIVLAYDDRRVMVNGKPIVSETGGTWRATDHMARRLEHELQFKSGEINELKTSSALNSQILLARHPNPENKILHTVLVEKNGFVSGVCFGRVALDDSDTFYYESLAYREHIAGRPK